MYLKGKKNFEFISVLFQFSIMNGFLGHQIFRLKIQFKE